MSKPELVITVALGRELPRDWLAERHVQIHRLRALQSGAYKARTGPNEGVLVVLTGVGLAASKASAEWIRDNLQPLFVLNIGTAGGLASHAQIGQWQTVNHVRNEAGDELIIDSRLPMRWPKELNLFVGATLVSVAKSLLDTPEPGWPGVDLVDMEAYAQAKVFEDTTISFHVLKSVSDLPGHGARESFEAHLERFREETKSILGFLEPLAAPDISVIIPVHNRQHEIRRCIESVLEQTLSPSKIIVVDDGSTDGTRDVIADFADRGVTLVALPANVGVSAARNAGVAASHSEWIAFLDSDDLWKPSMLAKIWSYLEAHPYYRALQSEEIWIRNGVRVNRHKHHKKPVGWIWHPSLHRCLVSPSAVMLERTLLDDLGGFDESLAVCEDYDLWLRLSRWHPVGLDPTQSLIKHGGHDDQLSRRYPAMDRFRVRALQKALNDETEPTRRAALTTVLTKKLQILSGGARKRGLDDEAATYESLLSKLDSQ